MNIKQLIYKHYAVNCPNCKHELSVYAIYSINEFAVKCNSCKKGYILQRSKGIKLTPSDAVDKINMDLLQYDEYHKYYLGTPTSQTLMPQWMRRFIK